MISVITVTYNNYDDLYRTLHSLRNVDGIEKIVVNGGDCKKTKNFLSLIKECLSISAYPQIISLFGSELRKIMSTITASGWQKVPIIFLPRKLFTPVFPPIDEST